MRPQSPRSARSRSIQGMLAVLLLPLMALTTPSMLSLGTVRPALAQDQATSSQFEPLTFTGELDSSDLTLQNGSYYQNHSFSGEAGQSIIIDLVSEEFDAYLMLLDTNGNQLAQNDDREGTNSRIAITLPETGNYTITASSFGEAETGSYTLTVQVVSASEVDQETQLATADQLNQQVDELHQQRRYDEAIPLAQQALEIRETILGTDHPDVAQSLNNLGLLYSIQGEYETAEALLQRSLAIREAALGPDHLDVANSLHNLAGNYHRQGNYEAAEALLQRSLSIVEAALGETDPIVATVLNGLARLYSDQRDYDTAERLYQRSLSILEAAYGESNPTTTNVRNALARVSQAREEYTAIASLTEALQLIEQGAQLFRERQYSEAISLVQQAVDLLEVVAENDPALASSLNFLAELHNAQGNYIAAEPLFLRSLSIRETALGENHPDVATSLNNLASLYVDQGNYAAAEPLYRRSLSIRETALGGNHPSVATSLNNLAELYQAQGNYTAAEPLYRRSLSIRETALGGNHPDVATSLNNLAELYRVQGNYTAAEPLYQRSLSIREIALSENHPDVATSLNNLATLYRVRGNYAAAEPLYQRSLSIYETALGENHPDVATSLNNLAVLYRVQGNYAAAEPLLQRSLSIFETTLGENHPDVATSLSNLAGLYQDQGNYVAAEPLYQRSLSIRETALGANHPDVALSLNNLAQLYQDQGNYAAAEPLYRRSLSIWETALGENHPNVASSLNNLAALYRAQGNYAAAEPLYQRSLSIRETALGANHPDVALSLNNLAQLYQDQGNYAAAEPLYRRSLSIYETALGENHPDVARSLNNLAGLYSEQGNYAAAEPLYQRSLTIRETALGENHPDVALSLNNLATLYRDQGNYAAAEPLLQRSLSIRETALGENHPDVANSLNNLAGLYQVQGNYAAAEPLYQRSLAIWETALGENHPDVALSLNNLAGLYQAQGNDAAALPLLERATESRETQLALTLTVVSEERRRAYLATLSGETNSLISFNLQDAPEATSLALTTLLRRKGRVLDATAESFRALREQLTPENQALLDELRTVETQRANLVLGEPVEGQAALLADLEARAEELQNTLARRSAEFRAETQPVTIEAIQQQIPADAALVELVRYEPFDAAASQQERWGNPRYAAYVLLPSGEILTVDLGDAAALEAQVFAFLDALRNPNSNIQPLARELDTQLMQPIRELVGDATHLLLSPDGALNLIPFAALMDERNTYLAERYTFTYLTSGRDLLRMQRETEPGQGPVIVANPDYGATVTAMEIPPSPPYQGGNRNQSPPYQGGNRNQSPPYQGGFRGISAQRSTDFDSLSDWSPLPGTEAELRAIAPLLSNPQILEGANATEDAVKQVDRPSILHIATHGFFLQDQTCIPRLDSRSIAIEYLGADATDCIPTPQNTENPLLRSGLVFAGVNQRRDRAEATEDGVLTAQEVTTLNLRGTQLVVLSACETGLGNVVNGDGVYGLRRAFVLAGAESQLMSLWQVSDEGTADLMTRYYQRLLAGEGRSEAMRNTQLDLLQTPNYAHPYYWASFIPAGNWRPLQED